MECPSLASVQALVAGDLPADDRDRLLSHNDGCSACHELFVALMQRNVATAETAPAPDAGSRRHLAILGSGVKVGRYEIERPIGAGGMGVVYRARDPELDRRVAVKLLHHAGADAVERMRREGRALAALSHTNVVAVYDVGDHDDGLFIAMELVDGDNLRGWCAKRTRSWSEIVRVAIAIGRGLEAAHAAGLVHRDIKPDNVLIGSDGRIRVSDFGLVEASASDRSEGGNHVDADLTQTGAILGTPAYMSPEQVAGAEVDARSDQWSYCVTIFETLYGVRPSADLAARPTRRVPGWLRRIVIRGLAADPNDRWPSMGVLCDALERGTRRRTRRAVIGSVAVISACAAGVWWATRPAPLQCDLDGEVPVAVWDAHKRAQISINNAGALETIDPWLVAWSNARRDACQVNAEDPKLRDRRQACLDGELGMFSQLVGRWTRHHAVDIQTQVQWLSSTENLMPSVAQCDQTAIVDRPIPTAEQGAQQRAVEDEIMQAHDAQLDHDMASATRIASHALATAKASGYPPTIALAAVALAAHQARALDWSGAETSERAALEAAEASHDDWMKTTTCFRLVEALAQNKHPAEARHFLDYARATATRLPPDPRIQIGIADAEGNVATAENDLAAVVVARRNIAALTRTTFGSDNVKFAGALIVLADALDAAGQREEAAATREESRVLWNKLGFDPDVLRLKDVHDLLAHGFPAYKAGDLETAISDWRRAVAILDTLPDQNSQVPFQLQMLAIIEKLADRTDQAYADLLRVIAIYDKDKRRDRPVADALDNAAADALELHRNAEAIALARRAIELAGTLGSDAEELVVLSETTLGRALVASGDSEAARVPLEHVVAWRADHGLGGRRGKAQFALATALWNGTHADHARALELARSARMDVVAYKASFPDSDPLSPRFRAIQQRFLDGIDAWLRTHH